ncbi:DUF6265 family protein [Belliella marina]|uniref:DUF6265 family protein n=1 Tax=Belliella marina TaxID=1644146 RepID=A0ABW4VUS5_9BACT
MKTLLFFFAGLLACYGNLQAQDVLKVEKNEPANTGKVEDLHWISGYWKGTGLGGDVDELWLPQMDNSMVGIFRYAMEGELVFSEYMHLIEEKGLLYLKIKHFGRDLVGWEEKEEWTTFKFIKSEGQTAYFSGLTFHRENDQLTIKLLINSKGTTHEESFVYQKTGL